MKHTMVSKNTVIESITALYDEMFSAERKVADCILAHPEKAVMMNVSELASFSKVSDATVIRMCKHAGYQGYYQMRIQLSHDLGRQANNNPKGKEPNTVEDVFKLFSSSLMEVAKNLKTDTLLDCALRIKEANMVHVVAAGNTTPIASDLGYRLSRYGIRTSHSPLPEYYLRNIDLAPTGDLVIAISKSGSSKQVLQALELAKQHGVPSIVITAYECSPASKLADYLLLTRSENELFYAHCGPESHLMEMAMNDILVYFVLNREAILKNIRHADPAIRDQVEMFLSEYKL